MSKLGYTWYPKDWGNSEAVFELNLSERGLYRELIDMAMLNDNTTLCNYKVWQRKWDIEHDDIYLILDKLSKLNLINYTINEDKRILDTIFIPSCEPRLKLVRGGKKGGEKSAKNKPTVKPVDKPLISLDEKEDNPTLNQKKRKETKLNIKESNSDEIFTHESFLIWFKQCRNYLGLKFNVKKLSTLEKQLFNELKGYTKEDFKIAFKNFSNDKYWNDPTKSLLMPKHFLNYEHFTKYLNAEVKTELTLGQKLMGRVQ
jgi:hypothetical protein